MRKPIFLLALVAVALLVVSSAAALAQDIVQTNTTAAFAKVVAGKEGGAYKRPSGSLTSGAVAEIPGAAEGGGGTPDVFAATAGTLVQAGPLSLGGPDLIASRGSALVGPSGAAVYSPQQRAAMDIRRLIRALD